MEGETFGVIGARELQNAAELALFISTVRKRFRKCTNPLSLGFQTTYSSWHLVTLQ